MRKIDRLLDLVQPDPAEKMLQELNIDALSMKELEWLASYLEAQLAAGVLKLDDPYFETLLNKMQAAKEVCADGTP